MKIAILGAGFSGIELGRRIKQQTDDFIVVEKESRWGGLCRTNKTKDFCWDFGVHALYSRSQDVMNYLKSLPINYEHRDRRVKIFHTSLRSQKTCIIDYPFEIGIKSLPLREKIQCIMGYFVARKKKLTNYSNLEDWIINFSGSGISRHFMVPYNSKIWNCDLHNISYSLVGSKIEPASIFEFTAAALGAKIVGRAYQARFIYPSGGIQNLIDYNAKGIESHVQLNSEVEKLVKRNNKWVIMISGREKIEADIIISTIPLVDLLGMVELQGLKQRYSVFKWNNTFFILIGLKSGFNFRFIKDCHWVFFKEDEVFYRITLMHNFSSGFPPALVVEVTQKGDILNKTQEQIVDLVVSDLLRKNIVESKSQIAVTDIMLIKHTYPIPTVGLEDVKKNVNSIFKKNGILLFGRNGNWDYINMDMVILFAEKFMVDYRQYFDRILGREISSGV